MLSVFTESNPLRCAIAARPLSKPRHVVTVWAQTTDELREAQRLRFEVFSGEMGARLNTPLPGHDIDRFDDYCEHLLVRDAATQQVVGTYRVLTPVQARRLGSTYCDGEFDLTPLAALRPRMVELGRSCVHPQHRHGGVILALWAALAKFMLRNHLDTMVGCASIPMQHSHAARPYSAKHLAATAAQPSGRCSMARTATLTTASNFATIANSARLQQRAAARAAHSCQRLFTPRGTLAWAASLGPGL